MRLPVSYIFYIFLSFIGLLAIFFDSDEIYPLRGTPKKNPASRSVFTEAYISTYKSGENKLNLFSKTLIDRPDINKLFLKFPKGEIGNSPKSTFSGARGIIDRRINKIFVTEKVKITRRGIKSTSHRLEVDYGINHALASGDVKSFFNEDQKNVKVFSDELAFQEPNHIIEYSGNVSGRINSKDNKKFNDIKFKSNLLIYDDYTKMMTLEGNAFIERAKSKMKSINAKINIDNISSGVKYFSMNDDVQIDDVFINSYGETIKRKSICEKLEGFSDEEKLVLSGFPQVEQEGDIIKGNEMIIREDKEMIEVINTNSHFNFNGSSD